MQTISRPRIQSGTTYFSADLGDESNYAPPDRSPAQLLSDACALLVEIAGPHDQHAEMNQPGKKYGPVYHPLGLEDARLHLLGKSTRAAWLAHDDGRTRALCFDGDNAPAGQILRDAAQLLYDAGYLPLWEPSPARGEHAGGGHLWIIYMGLVDTRCALRHVCEIAPMLASGFECWPGLRRNVRLPGGVYVTPDFRARCTIWDHAGLVASTPREVAQALLTYQTPTVIVPDYPPEPVTSLNVSEVVILPPVERIEDSEGRVKLRTDGPTFTTAQLADWFNRRHSLESILPPVERGALPRAFPTWREHGPKPNVVYYRKTNTWCDFGDGQRGGDALDLYILVSGQEKKEVLRQLGQQYRAELLDQAQTSGGVYASK